MADTTFVDVENKEIVTEPATGTSSTTSASMAIGVGSKVFRGDQSGIWLGASKFSDAPFRVDMDGNLVATSLTISGYVTKIGGTYTSTATAAAAKVKIFPDANTGIIAYTSDGTTVVFKVTVGGTDVGDVVIGNYAGGVGMLWDQSAGNLIIKGDMAAGNITGVTFQTAASGSRVEITAASSKITIYNSAGNPYLELDNEQIIFASRSTRSSETNCIYYYKSGGSYGFKTRMESGDWAITQAAW